MELFWSFELDRWFGIHDFIHDTGHDALISNFFEHTIKLSSPIPEFFF